MLTVGAGTPTPANTVRLNRLGYTDEESIPLARDKPGIIETGGAMFRREHLGFNMLTDSIDDSMLPSMEEYDEALKSGFSPTKLVAELENRNNAPQWLVDDDESKRKLLTTRTPAHFQRTLDQLSDHYADSQTLEDAPWYVALPLGMGVGVIDPPSMIVGGVAGGLVRTGVHTSKAIQRGSALTYSQVQRNIANDVRYLTKQNVNAVKDQALKARATVAKRLDSQLALQAKMKRPWQIGGAVAEAGTSALAVELGLLDQPSRTEEEIIYNVFGSVALSGFLSGGGASFGGFFGRTAPGISKAELTRARTAMDHLVDGTDSVMPEGAVGTRKPRPKDAPAVDQSPVALDNGLLPAHMDAVLRSEYKMDASPTDAQIMGYYKMRKKAANKYMGVKSSIPLRILSVLSPGLRMKINQSMTVREFAGRLISADYMEAGAHTNGRIRDSSTVEISTQLAESKVRVDLREWQSRSMATLAKAAERPDSNFTNPTAWQSIAREHFAGKKNPQAELDIELSKYIHDPEGYVPSAPFRGMEAEIHAIAMDYRKTISEPWEARQLDSGVLTKAEIPEGSLFYLNRRYNMTAINDDPTGFEIALTNEIEDSMRRGRLRDVQQEHIDAKKGGDLPELDAETLAKIRAEANKEALDFIESVRGHPLHLGKSDIPGAKLPGSLQSRAPIRSKAVMDYLDHNLSANTAAWIKALAPEVALTEKFGVGYNEKITAAVMAERSEMYSRFDELIKKATSERTKKALRRERKRVEKDFEQGAADLTRTIEVIRNEFGMPDDPNSRLLKAGKVLRTHNYVTKLGGMMVSSLVDPSYIMIKAGLGDSIRALGHGMGGWPSFRRGMNQLESEFRSRGTKAFKEYRSDAHIMGIVGELVGNTRADQIAMLNDPGEMSGMWAVAPEVITSGYSKLTLMTRWNDWAKTVSHMAFTLRTERALNEGDAKWLAEVGIDDATAKVMKRKWAESGQRQQGTTSDGLEMDFVAPDLRTWHVDDPEGKVAQDVMRNVMRRLVDSTVVGPGAGDIPFILRTPLGKILGQFMAFPLSITSRVMIPALQRSMPGSGQGWQARALMTGAGFTMATAMGMNVYMMKTMLREGVEDGWDTLEENGMKRALVEGLERSGIFGPYERMFNVADDMVDGALLQGLLGEDYEGGYVSQDPLLDATSVSVSTFKDWNLILRGVKDLSETGSMSWGAGSAVRRQTIGNNLFYLHYFNQEVQKQIPFIRESTTDN